MSRKTKEFLVLLARKLKVLMPTLRFSEVASVYRIIKQKFVEADPDEVMFTLSTFCLMVTSLALTVFMVFLFLCFF